MNATERASFLRMLRPPEGYRLGAGLSTTYSLELDTLTAALLALAGRKQEDDSAAALDALLEIGGTFRIFANRGCVKLGRGVPPPLVALLDTLLCEVNLATSFHPKVWVLEFDPINGTGGGVRRRYRVLCTSRNLTSARTWELAACFEGVADPGGGRDPLAEGVASFVKRCIQEHTGAAALGAMAKRLGGVRFSVDKKLATKRDLLWQWTGERTPAERAIALPARARRALVVSPFLDEEFLRRVSTARSLSVVSTQSGLDKLDAAFLGGLEERGVRLHVVRGRDAVDGVEPLELHAKLVAWERGRDRATLLGSANGTSRGFGLGKAERRNVEAMTRLRPGISIDRFEREFLKQPWVSDYVRSRAPVAADEARERASRVLGQLAKDLVVEGEWQRARGEVVLRARFARRGRKLVPEEANATLRPAWLDRDPGAALAIALGAGATFTATDPAVISRLAMLRVEIERESAEAVIEMSVELPADRDAAARRKLLASANPVALLRGALGLARGTPSGGPPWDGGGGDADAPPPPGSGTKKPNREEGAPEDVPTLEEVLRACVESPRFVAKVRSLVDARPEVAALMPYWNVLDRVLSSAEAQR